MGESVLTMKLKTLDEVERRGKLNYCRMCGIRLLRSGAVAHVRNEWRRMGFNLGVKKAAR